MALKKQLHLYTTDNNIKVGITVAYEDTVPSYASPTARLKLGGFASTPLTKFRLAVGRKHLHPRFVRYKFTQGSNSRIEDVIVADSTTFLNLINNDPNVVAYRGEKANFVFS